MNIPEWEYAALLAVAEAAQALCLAWDNPRLFSELAASIDLRKSVSAIAAVRGGKALGEGDKDALELAGKAVTS